MSSGLAKYLDFTLTSQCQFEKRKYETSLDAFWTAIFGEKKTGFYKCNIFCS